MGEVSHPINFYCTTIINPNYFIKIMHHICLALWGIPQYGNKSLKQGFYKKFFDSNIYYIQQILYLFNQSFLGG